MKNGPSSSAPAANDSEITQIGNSSVKKFALLGAAGYVAPRHMKAIKETGNELVATLDKSDSVGIIDSYFPQADFFTEFERFDRHIDLRRRNDMGVDYVSICTPNYLHDSHTRFGLRSGAHVICEKPLVLNPWNIEGLANIEKETGKRVHTILQLRLHPAVQKLKQKLDAQASDHIHDVELTYLTSRGRWYLSSWKAAEELSGGITTNIGVHFFDLLSYLFGSVVKNVLHYSTNTTEAGYLEFERARVRWCLSIDERLVPEEVAASGQKTFRSLQIDGEEFEFSGGFTDLHTLSYEHILSGNGFSLEDNMASIETVAALRTMQQTPSVGERHPTLEQLASPTWVKSDSEPLFPVDTSAASG